MPPFSFEVYLMRLTSINDIRAQEWARAYLWDIEFPDFTKLFPAVDVEEKLFTLQHHEVTLYQSTYNVPFRTSAFDLKVTFIEYADHSTSNWLSEWVNERILGKGQYVQTVEDASRIVKIHKLKPDRSILKTSEYLVVPEGELYFHGSSDSTPESVSLSFQIVGL